VEFTAAEAAVTLSRALVYLAEAVTAVVAAAVEVLLVKARALLAAVAAAAHYTYCLFKEKNGKNFCSN